MPPLRALKTDEEIAAIPLDQPILVELPGGVIDEEPGEVIKPPKEEKVEPPDNGAKVLQEQLEAAQRAQAASDARAAKAEREADDARKAVAEANKRTATLEGDVITGGLAAAQAEVASAKLALQNAGEAGDYKGMADAQERIARAASKVLNYEAGAAEIAERPKEEPRQEQTLQAPADPIAAVDANPHLMPAEKTWLKAHPDAITDMKRNNKLGVAYDMALEKNLVRGTPAYFEYLEEFMGYKTKAPTNDDDNNDGSGNVQAPPSRQERGSDGKPSGNKIMLSPDERATAASMGISETEYALNKQKMQADMKTNPEKYGRSA